MAITAAQVKQLRDVTGAGMMDCKKALTECNGDMDAAVEFLRKKGQAKAEKKANRIAAEGICYIAQDGDTKAAVVEVNSETDFVAQNEKFRTYVAKVAQQALNTAAEDIDAFMGEAWAEDTAKTVKDSLVDMIAVISEKLSIRRFKKIEETEGCVVTYLHGQGRIGVIVDAQTAVVNDEIKTALTNVAMQIAAMNPSYVKKEEISAETLSKEKEIVVDSSLADPASLPKPILNAVIQEALDKNLWGADDKAAYEAEKNNKFWYNFMSNEGMQVLRDIAASHKAETIENKIFAGLVEGRFSKRLKEICLVDQLYVKAEDKEDVAQYIAKVAKENGCTFNVNRFVRFETGEGLEKRNEDFAAEVAKQMGQ